MAIAGRLILNQGTTPDTPDAGKIAVYSKSNDKLYYKTDDGVEHEVTASGSSATTWLELTDTPAAYNDGLYVRSTTSGLEFATVSGGVTTLIGLSDTPSAYDNNKYLRSTASGTVWATVSGGTGTSDHSLLSNLDYASAGHTGFASTSVTNTLDTKIDTTSGTLQTQITSNTTNITNNTASVALISGTVDELDAIRQDEEEPNGFVNRTDSTLSFTSGTRTVALTGTYDIYIDGEKKTHTNDSVVIANTNGLHYVYYNTSNVLSSSLTPWDIGTGVPTATVLWNTTLASGILGEERHGIVMDSATHKYLHDTIGTRYESGLAISGYTLNTDTNDAVTFGLEAGEIHDEDIEINVPAAADPAQISVFYRDGVGGPWKWDAPTNYPYKYTSRINYNLNTAGTWSQQEATDRRYVAYWIFATNSVEHPYISIQGQREDVSLADAVENNAFSEVAFGDIPFAEIKVIYRIIVYSRNLYTNDIKSVIAEVTDYRVSSVIAGGTTTVNDHGSLSGLADNDHPQYLLTTDFTTYSGTLQSQITSNDSDIADNTTLIATTSGTLRSDIDTNAINLTTHSGTANIHFLATSVDHNAIVNTHNLTSDIDHNQLTNYDANRHFLEGDIDHGSIAGLGDDDHTQYHNDTRGDIRYYTQAQVDTLIGQATYSGTGVRGKINIPNGTNTVDVDMGATISGNYYPNISIENTIDANPSQFGMIVTDTTTSGFTVLFSSPMDSVNYYLNWRVGNDAIGGGSGITAIVQDITPQLGGALDMNGFNIEGVTPTEMGYVSGVTSAIQTQLDSAMDEIVDDTSPQLGGDLDLNENAIELNPNPTSDDTGNGLIATMTVDTDPTTVGRALYMASDGNLDPADADSATTMPCIAISLESGTGSKKVLLRGFIRNDGWNWSSIGQPVYVSTTAGIMTQTAPSGSGDQVQRVGIAISADVVYFSPDMTVIEVA